MKRPKNLSAAVSAATLVLTLSACGDDGGTNEPQTKQTAANGDVFNKADVDFATAMIPHHAQALVMVDTTRGRDLSPGVQELAEDIREAQGPEIEQMVGWLTAWGEPIPETMRDHTNAENHGMTGQDIGGDDGSDVPGMMTDEDITELEAALGEEFETLWLEMMIEHHGGAVAMAQEEQQEGIYQPAVELAEAIETSQQAEIAHMEGLLAS